MLLYLETGMRILVPFGRGNTMKVAYFLDLVPYDDKLKNIELKYISEILDDQSILSKNMFKLAKKIKDQYFCTYGQVLNAMVPLGLKISIEKLVLEEDGNLIPFQTYLKSLEGGIKELNEKVSNNEIKIVEQGVRNIKKKSEKTARLLLSAEELSELMLSDQIKNERHLRILELLNSYEDISVTDFAAYENISRAVLNTLVKKGYIEIFDKPKKEEEIEKEEIDINPSNLVLTSEQKKVIDRISLPMENETYDKFLIHGITGSGKTEVYLNLVEKTLNSNKAAIVLVPEIALTPMMVDRFSKRFGKNLVVMHSRLSMKERYNAWMRIKRNEVMIALGTRSCIFAPFENLGLIIIDEEHDNSYISDSTPKYHTNFVADQRAQIHKAVLVLGSATPKVSTFFGFLKIDRILTMEKRASGALPHVQLVDMREDAIRGKLSVFSSSLLESIKNNLDKKEQTVLFLNRRGFSSIQLCTSCKNVVKCQSCDVPMTYHKSRNRLICHYCGSIQEKEKVCSHCKEESLIDVGSGTEKCESELKEIFPQASIIRMDLDTTGMKNSHKEILERFEKEKIDILIGTQMIAKGHDYPLVTLVGILNADMLGAGAFFESNENAFQLMTQSAGRAGRADLEGKAIIQTYNIDSELMGSAINQDYPSFYNSELRIRRILDFPPFTNMAYVIFSAPHKHVSQEHADLAYKLLRQTNMTVFAPSDDRIAKISDRYRTRIIIKHKNSKELNLNLTKLQIFMLKKLPSSVNMSFDVYRDSFGIW